MASMYLIVLNFSWHAMCSKCSRWMSTKEMSRLLLKTTLSNQPRVACLLYDLLDVDLARTATRSLVFGAIKGALDGGFDIPDKEKRFPGFKNKEMLDPEAHWKHILGECVAAYTRSSAENVPKKYQDYFSKYLKRGIKVDKLEALYKKVHATIRADSSPVKSFKHPPKQ